MKIASQLCSSGFISADVKTLFLPKLEVILKLWIQDSMDDVSSLIQDLILDSNLPNLGKSLNLAVIGELINLLNTTCKVAYESSTQSIKQKPDHSIFDKVKKVSYCIETLAEEFVTSPSAQEFNTMSKLLLSAIDLNIECYSSYEGTEEEVIWSYGRKASWMSWLCAARKHELTLNKARPSNSLLVSTIEAYTANQLTKNDWNLFLFCLAKCNYRDAACTLARIWTISPFEAEKLCKAFLKIKLSALSDASDCKRLKFKPGRTLYEFVVRQFQMLALYSMEECDEKRDNISEEDWTEFAQAEIDTYVEHDATVFKVEIDYLKSVLAMDNAHESLLKGEKICGSL
jgi:hypothetical protein